MANNKDIFGQTEQDRNTDANRAACAERMRIKRNVRTIARIKGISESEASLEIDINGAYDAVHGGLGSIEES